MTHQLLASCPEAAADGLMGDPACAPVIYTTKTRVSKATKIRCCLRKSTCAWWAHAASDSCCKQQQAGDSHGCHGHCLFGARPLCWEQSSVNEPCVQEVSGYDITADEKRKKKKEKEAARGLLCMSRLTRPTHKDMLRWLTRPLTVNGVMSLDRVQTPLREIEQEWHDELGISFTWFRVLWKNDQKGWAHSEPEGIGLWLALTMWIKHQTGFPVVNKHAQCWPDCITCWTF